MSTQQVPTEVVLNGIRRTDSGNAEAFTAMYGELTRYDHARKRWLIWDTHRWRPDEDGTINRMAINAMRALQEIAFQATDELDEEQRKKLFTWAVNSESRARLSALLELAKSKLPIADSGKGWDETKGLVGAPNGVIDLRTGLLRNGQPSDRITKQVGTLYDPEAERPRWERFLTEVLEDEATVAYVKRLAGYSLAAEASEDLLIFLMGDGGNGKTTLLEFLRLAAGEYNQEVSALAILDERASGHTTEVADLEGSRLATCEEIGDAKLNANRLKQLSGGSPITARRMRQDNITFAPTWQLWFSTNGLPRANDNTWAFWRRVVAIDFPNRFTAGDEPDLEATLRGELQGILAWIVEGAVEYYRDGLGAMPEAVKQHTAQYRDDVDPLQPVYEAGYLVEQEDAWSPTTLLYGAYLRWASETHAPYKMGEDSFAKALAVRFSRDRKQIDGSKQRGFAGVVPAK